MSVQHISDDGHDLAPGGALKALAVHCANQLMELRSKHGETQKVLAKRLGMTESMISRLERGDHVPSLKTLCRIADAFGGKIEIIFHSHEHTHADGTRHSHPHVHDGSDPLHNHLHADGDAE